MTGHRAQEWHGRHGTWQRGGKRKWRSTNITALKPIMRAMAGHLMLREMSTPSSERVGRSGKATNTQWNKICASADALPDRHLLEEI
uniref:Uncharacterized protein n=1 Tax=Plectus sambesii TaxID=2011161 RepID=A0A914XJM2_9BILA